MKEIRGNLWDYHKQGYWIVITTNGTIKSNGEAVMGRGVALQAKKRFPELPYKLGGHIGMYGNNPSLWYIYRIITLPTKHNFWEKSDLGLIEEGIHIISVLVDLKRGINKIYMVRPGCGNGGLNWEDSKPVLEKYLDDRFIIVEKK